MIIPYRLHELSFLQNPIDHSPATQKQKQNLTLNMNPLVQVPIKTEVILIDML